MAEVLIGRGNRAAQGTNPYGAAFGGLAQILAQLNLGKANSALEKAAQEKEEQNRQNQAKALEGSGLSPEQTQAILAADPAVKSQLMAKFLEGPKPETAMGQFGAGDQMMLGSAEKQFHNLTPESQAAMVSALNGAGEFASGAALGAGGMASASPGQVGPPLPGFGLDPSQFQMAQKPPSGLDKMAGAVGDLAGAMSKTVQVGEDGSVASQPTSAVDNQLQKDLASVDELQGRLDSIVLENADELLTRGGKAKSWFAKQANEWLGDALPGDDNSGIEGAVEERVRLATEFKNQSMQLFNVYRKLITGAAASVQELKMLLDSYLNSEMGPEEFKASYQVVKQSLERDKRRLEGYLREGFTIQEAQEKVVAQGQADKVAEAMNDTLGEIDEEEDDSDPLGLFR